MRASLVSLVVVVIAAFATSGCGEVAIGQPCMFTWPIGNDLAPQCQKYPTCHPLQVQDPTKPVEINNLACPLDCFQTSLECANLICIATQIEGDNLHMNGQCDTAHNVGQDCTSATLGCYGYCTKDCLSDASCPKGYRCSPVAPFGETLNCENEADWDANCTGSCTPAGPGVDDCPSTANPTDITAKCSQRDYKGCCACICSTYCSITQKKVCRKTSWDQKLFPSATTEATDCTTND